MIRIGEVMERSEAYKLVYDDLIKYNMFKGIYDAVNGNISFMNGVACVMEVIANDAGQYDEFTELFSDNILKSEKKAKTKS